MSWRDSIQKAPTEAPSEPNSGSSWRDSIKQDASIGESLLRGGAQGASFGFADEITGGLEAAGDVISSPSKFAQLAELYRQHRDESRQNYV